MLDFPPTPTPPSPCSQYLLGALTKAYFRIFSFFKMLGEDFFAEAFLIFPILVFEDHRKYSVGGKLTCKYEGIIEKVFLGKDSKP